MSSQDFKEHVSFSSEKWEEKAAGDVFDICVGCYGVNSYTNIGDFPAILSRDLLNTKSVYFSKCKTFVDKNVVKGALCSNGDILIVRLSMSSKLLGKSFLYIGEKECAVDSKIYIIKHNHNSRYLVHFLNSRSFQKQIKNFSEKRKILKMDNKLDINDFKKIKILVPPLYLQEQVANHLDNLLNSRNNINDNLEILLMRRKQQYEYYKEILFFNEINKLGTKSLSKIVTDIYIGSEVKKKLLGSGKEETITCGDLNSKFGVCFNKCINCVNGEFIKNKKYFEFGDVLISLAGQNNKTVGSSSAYLGNKNGILGVGVGCLKHKQNPKYLSYVLSSKFCRQQISKLMKGVTFKYLLKKDIEKIKIPLPPLEEQEKIVAILDECTQTLADMEQSIRLLQQKRNKQYDYYSNRIFASN